MRAIRSATARGFTTWRPSRGPTSRIVTAAGSDHLRCATSGEPERAGPAERHDLLAAVSEFGDRAEEVGDRANQNPPCFTFPVLLHGREVFVHHDFDALLVG
jgi:hypothetical protein